MGIWRGDGDFFQQKKDSFNHSQKAPREKILTSHSRGPRCGSCGAHASPPRPWRTTRGGRRARRGRFSIGGSGGEDLRAILRRCDEGVVAHASDGGSSTTMTFLDWIGSTGSTKNEGFGTWSRHLSTGKCRPRTPCGRWPCPHVNTHTPSRSIRPMGWLFLPFLMTGR